MSLIHRSLVAMSLCACTTGSPLTRIDPQIEIHSNPGNVSDRGPFALSMTTWVDLDVLHDAIASGEITATVNGTPLVIDQATTGYFGQHDSYVASFALPGAMTLTSTPAEISITDGQTSWSAVIEHLFANDLAAMGPTAQGPNTFVWPSAAATGPDSPIDWACIEVDGQPSACGGYEVATPAIGVSQQFITANLSGAPGTKVTVTAERTANRDPSGDGPTFLARIVDRLDTTL